MGNQSIINSFVQKYTNVCLFLFFCLTRELFTNMEPITGEGLHILTYARHSSPLGSEGSLACHTYCGTGHPYNNGHLRGPVTLTPNDERFAVELSLPVLTT